MKNFDAFKHHGDVVWNIANLLRGPYRPPQHRRVIIPLTVLRRLDCVLEKTKGDVLAMHKKLKPEKKDAEAYFSQSTEFSPSPPDIDSRSEMSGDGIETISLGDDD